MTDHPGHGLVVDMGKASPVVAVSIGQWLMHVDWQPIVLMLTLIYTGFLVVEKIYKFWKWLQIKRAT